MDGLILAGGKSSRMGGEHKGALTLNKETFTGHVIKEMQKMADNIWISYGDKVHMEFDNVKVISDVHKNIGPIEGIYQGLLNCKSDMLLVSACDMPFVKKELYSFLLEKMYEAEEKSGEIYEGVVPTSGGRYHTLSAIYKKESAKYFKDSIDRHTYSIRSALDKMNMLYVPVDEIKEFHKMLENINTKEEYMKFKNMDFTA